MSQNIFFLDTNVILDYIENRNRYVKGILDQMIKYKDKGLLAMSTSILNIAETLDKSIEINYMVYCFNNKMSMDETRKNKGNYSFYKEIAGKNRSKIELSLQEFIAKTDLQILSIPYDGRMEDISELLCSNCIQSQDATMVAAALYHESDYLITADQNLINSLENKIYTFNFTKKEQRDTFRQRVLMALG